MREDRRHINELDLKQIKSKLKIPLNLEIAATKEMLNIALKRKPPFICIVPEKRQEVTTEGGLNLKYRRNFLKKVIDKLKKNNSRISLFVEPNIHDITDAKNLNADCVEIHTGKFCNLINKKKNYKNELLKIQKAVDLSYKKKFKEFSIYSLPIWSMKSKKKIKMEKCADF